MFITHSGLKVLDCRLVGPFCVSEYFESNYQGIKFSELRHEVVGKIVRILLEKIKYHLREPIWIHGGKVYDGSNSFGGL